MKIMSTVLGVSEKTGNVPAVPPEMFRQHDVISQNLAVLMRVYNLCNVSIAIVPTVPVAVVNPSYKLIMDDTMLPNELLIRRPKVLREAFCCIMALYGFTSLDIALSAQELNELKAYWLYLTNGNTEKLDNIQFAKVPLHVDTDPEKPGVEPQVSKKE